MGKPTSLRGKLREITDDPVVDGHAKLIAQLRRSHPHSIEILPSPSPISRYTCAVHALGLIENAEYESIVLASPYHVFASMSFVQRLIDRSVLRAVDRADSGDLVIYRRSGVVKHIGRIISEDRAESKWGIGHLYRHGLFEVPSQYGRRVEFFRKIDADLALDELVILAKENGVRFVGDA